jgi:hypothetical protein
MGRNPAEEQVVDRARQDHGLEVHAGELGQRAELIDGMVVSGGAEPCRELVHRTVGARGTDGDELGRQRKGEMARGRSGMPRRREPQTTAVAGATRARWRCRKAVWAATACSNGSPR